MLRYIVIKIYPYYNFNWLHPNCVFCSLPNVHPLRNRYPINWSERKKKDFLYNFLFLKTHSLCFSTVADQLQHVHKVHKAPCFSRKFWRQFPNHSFRLHILPWMGVIFLDSCSMTQKKVPSSCPEKRICKGLRNMTQIRGIDL